MKKLILMILSFFSLHAFAQKEKANSFIEKGLWDEARVFTAPSPIEHGIAAPVLTNANKAFETEIESDLLELYINNNSLYPYVQGMEL